MSQLPTLYHRSKTKALCQWRVWVDGNSVYTEYGQTDGQLQITPGKVCQGKNLGKKNATTDEQQAELEAAAMHEFKLSRKYRLTPDEAEEQLFLPMLATDIEKIKKPVYVGHCQPKSDGVRCIARLVDGTVELMSRSGKPYSVPHVESALLAVLDTQTVLDGELYCHGLSCQTITSLVKRNQPDSLKLGYHIYDIPVSGGLDNLSSAERMQLVADSPLDSVGHPIYVVPTYPVTTREQIYDLQREFIQQGYEGAMLRLPETPYEWGYRSKSLLKIKTFDDLEATVVGAREGDGKMAGCVIWLCQTTDGKDFECSMACPMDERARYWRERDQYIGRKLTVKHFGFTDSAVPRFPVAKLFRPLEDLPT